MGYTHYWKIDSEITPEKFRSLQSIAARIVCESEASVEFSMNTNQHPDHADICLNGIGENAHETFLLTPHKAKFEFCKTNRKPYDEIVVGILLVATGRGLLEFTSDGSGDELSAGRQLKNKVLYEKALAKKKLFDRKVARKKQMEAQGTGDEFLDASPTVKAALTSVLAKAETARQTSELRAHTARIDALKERINESFEKELGQTEEDLNRLYGNDDS